MINSYSEGATVIILSGCQGCYRPWKLIDILDLLFSQQHGVFEVLPATLKAVGILLVESRNPGPA